MCKKMIMCFLSGFVFCGCAWSQDVYRIAEKIPLEKVWSAASVGFDLLTEGDQQFVAFYDADRQMTVAQRSLNSTNWTFKKLSDVFAGWDSHNYITMALDQEGCLHISGDMHVMPLVYFRSEKPHDITSIVKIESMTGEQEKRCTYPKFIKGPKGELIFTYRDGSSGDGNQIYNVYDLKTKTWSRLLDRPLTDGQGLMNAYIEGPVLGPDGWFHMTWIWRDTIYCESNHDLCYARSRDLVHWETAGGTPIPLPIRLDTPGVLVDPVPVKGGMLNGNGKIGFDSRDRVILAYHKFDETGNTQLYNARYEQGGWKIYQTSDWHYRWYFFGGGSINTEISIAPVKLIDGQLTQYFQHKTEGSHTWVLDEKTLKPTGTMSRPGLPGTISRVRSAFPQMTVKRTWDRTTDSEYLLRWEALPNHRDAPRPEPWPEPVMLELYKLTQ